MGKIEISDLDMFKSEPDSPSLPTAFRGFKKADAIKFIDDIIKKSQITSAELSGKIEKLSEELTVTENDKQILLVQTKELCEKLEASEKAYLSEAGKVQYAEETAEHYKCKLFAGEQEKSLMKSHINKLEEELEDSKNKIEELVELYKTNNIFEDSGKFTDTGHSNNGFSDERRNELEMQRQEIAESSKLAGNNLILLERDIVEIEDRLVSAYKTVHQTQSTVQSAIVTANKVAIEDEPTVKYEHRFNTNPFDKASKSSSYELPKYDVPQSQINRTRKCYEPNRQERKDNIRSSDLGINKSLNSSSKNLSELLLVKLNKILG